MLQTSSGRSRAFVLLCALLFNGALAAWAASPAAVSNVQAKQRDGTKLVDIQYDLSYSGTSPIVISILVSSNSGALWNVPAFTFGGDYGIGVSPGLGKRVVWNAGADWIDQYTTNCRVRVLASPGWWTLSSAPKTNWTSVASSADGTRLVAAVFDGGIYTTTDSGATWTQQTKGLPANAEWASVASSADGIRLVAVADARPPRTGGIYTSTDSGATWAQQTGGLLSGGWWNSVASSADGKKLVVGANVFGGICTSADLGINWTLQTAGLPGTALWSVASSADRAKLVAVDYGIGVVGGGGIYTFGNSGANWIKQTKGLPAEADWTAVASSADGTRLVAVATGVMSQPGGIYTSTDLGASWAQQTTGLPPCTGRPGSANWSSVASSADGTRLVAAVYDGGIYTSTDSGATWTQQTAGLPASAQWRQVACSADGIQMVAVIDGGGIYTVNW